MSDQLYIFPMGGNGVEALDCLNGNTYTFAGFIDDNKKGASNVFNQPVWGREVLLAHPASMVLAVPGSPVSFLQRKAIIASLQLPENRLATLIHPHASVGKNVHIGRNCLIMAGVVVTSNAWIGDHVCILPNTVIHHDVRIGDYTLIGSNVVVAGGTIIGENCYIGSGTNIMNHIVVGEKTLVGLGSNVLKDIPPGSRIAGNPARAIGKK